METANEFLLKNVNWDLVKSDDIERAMIEFAKMHVQAALLKASEEVALTTNKEITSVIVYKPSILNSYSLDNIK